MDEYKRMMDSYECLQVSSVVKVNDWFWTNADNFNGIYRFSLENLSPEYITMFKEEGLFEKELYSSGIVGVGNKLYFVPGNAGNIAVYNIGTCEMKYIDSEDIQRGYHPAFGLIVCHKKNIYLFPLELQLDNYILKINTDLDQIERIRYKSNLKNFNIEKTEKFFFGDYAYPKAWIGLGVRGHYGEYDFEKQFLKIKKLELCDSFVYHITECDRVLYFLTFNNKVIRLKEECEEVIWESEEKAELLYSRMICIGNDLWILPFLSDMIIKIDLFTKDIKKIVIPSMVHKWKRWGVFGRKYYEYLVLKKCFYLFPANVDYILQIDLNNDNVNTIFFESNQGNRLKTEFVCYEKNRIHVEDDVRYLIDIISNFPLKSIKPLERKVGNKVIEKLKKII